MELKVVRWLIDKLIPYARNARTHSPEQIAQVAASITEFGFVNPILVGADNVNNRRSRTGCPRLPVPGAALRTDVPVQLRALPASRAS